MFGNNQFENIIMTKSIKGAQTEKNQLTSFAKGSEMIWQYRNYCYIKIGKEAPEVYPVCLHLRIHIKVKKKTANYIN